MKSKSLTLLIGIIFIVVGLLGFVSNPIVGTAENAIFHADTTHSVVHILSGIIFVLVAMAAPAYASMLCMIFGAVYLLIGIIGIATMGDDGMASVLGFLHVNGADNILHLALGVVIFLAGWVTRGKTTTT